MYYNGKGTNKNYSAAASFYTKASDMGIDEAMYRLADMYMEGQGVEKDNVQAYEWMQIAFRLGNKKAIGSRDWPGFQMAEDEIMKAKILALFTLDVDVSPEQLEPTQWV